MRDADKEHALEYAQALQQLDNERVQSITGAAAAAFSSFGAIVGTFSDLQRAESEAAVARTEREYDAKIKAAEGDREQTEKLEAEKQAAVAKIKNDYNQRAANIQVAQALAGGAMAAINAYSSAAAIPIVGHVLAPIAAALAVATTAAQIATIRKQAEAQQSGYYEGGFTPGRRYRRTAGVVHEGEFVANHKAVNNPAVLPVLRLIDHAQRNNTIASLTAADVSRAIAAPGVPPQGRTPDAEGSATRPAMAQRRAQPDTVPADTVAQGLQEAIDRLNVNLESGIRSTVSIDGRDGVAYQLDKFRKLTDRK